MSTADDNRAAFPETARIVDELRDIFGPGVKLIWDQENGREIGKKMPEGVPCAQEMKPLSGKSDGGAV